MELSVTEATIPDLKGKIALVSGGAAGIGFAVVRILAAHNATTYVLDVEKPKEPLPARTTFFHCDVTSWIDLRSAFASLSHLDIAIANAGVSEEQDYFRDTFDAQGELKRAAVPGDRGELPRRAELCQACDTSDEEGTGSRRQHRYHK